MVGQQSSERRQYTFKRMDSHDETGASDAGVVTDQ